MGISAEELALKEMRVVIGKMHVFAPTPQFTETGAGPYFEPSEEYETLRERLRWLSVRFPAQWSRLTADEQSALTAHHLTLAGLRSLSSSLGSPIGVAPEAA